MIYLHTYCETALLQGCLEFSSLSFRSNCVVKRIRFRKKSNCLICYITFCNLLYRQIHNQIILDRRILAEYFTASNGHAEIYNSLHPETLIFH